MSQVHDRVIPGNAKKENVESRSIAPPIFNLDFRRRRVVSFRPRTPYPRQKPPVLFEWGARWAPGPVCTLKKIKYFFIIYVFLLLCLMYSYCTFMCLHRASSHSSATLTEVCACFFLSCKANARVKPAKTGHGPHSSKIFVLFYVLFVLCRSVYCLCVCVYVCACVRARAHAHCHIVLTASTLPKFLCYSTYCLFCVVLCSVYV